MRYVKDDSTQSQYLVAVNDACHPRSSIVSQLSHEYFKHNIVSNCYNQFDTLDKFTVKIGFVLFSIAALSIGAVLLIYLNILGQ